MSRRRYRDLAERLMANSIVCHETGCWDWIGKRHYAGYGLITLRVADRLSPVNRKAHRVAYEVLKGPIAPGMEIDHKCRNRCCINPDHLREATPSENCANRGGRFAA